jgi:hypothetical protein
MLAGSLPAAPAELICMTEPGRFTMIKRPFHPWPLAALSLLLTLASADTLRADIVVLDDFSTPIEFNAGSFSRSDDRNDFWAPEVTIAPGVTATWYDDGAGILGGRRDVSAQNATTSAQSSMISIDGYLSVNSPSANFLCATCLSYTFAAINVEIHHRFVIDVLSLDPAAKGNILGTLTLKDRDGKTATANFAATALNVGRNKLELQGMQNWWGIDRTSVVFAEMAFMTTQPAVDFTIDALAFSTNPEPSTFAIMGLVFTAAAVVHFRKTAKTEKSD